jgi:hypothetical protein
VADVFAENALSFLHEYTEGIANGCGIYSKGRFIRKVLTALAAQAFWLLL